MRPSITVLRTKMLRERYEVFMYTGIDVSNRSAMEYPTQHRRSTRHTRVKAQVTHGFSSQDRSFGGLGESEARERGGAKETRSGGGKGWDQKVGPDRPSLRLLPVRMSACVKGVSLASILRLLLAHVVYPGPAGRRGEGKR